MLSKDQIGRIRARAKRDVRSWNTSRNEIARIMLWERDAYEEIFSTVQVVRFLVLSGLRTKEIMSMTHEEGLTWIYLFGIKKEH